MSSELELVMVHDFVCLQVKLDGVVSFNLWVGESDGSSIVGDDEGNSFWSHSSALNSA